MPAHFTPPPKTITQFPLRKGDIRLNSVIQSLKPTEFDLLKAGDCVLIGCPDDRGVKKNKGRPGARKGPTSIRTILYRMTPSYRQYPFQIWDLGDFKMSPSLAADQTRLQQTLVPVLKTGATVILLGGGHDWGFCDSSALALFAQDQRQAHVVVNMDAHADFRPYPDGPHSGSPFRQLMDQFSGPQYRTSLFELGLQYHCNSPEYLDDARAKQVNLFFQEDFLAQNVSLIEKLKSIMELRQNSLISLSLDMDSIQGVFGVSASYPLGFTAAQVLKAIHLAAQNASLRTLGFFETNPMTDVGDHTSKLAAHLISEFFRVRALSQSSETVRTPDKLNPPRTP